MSLQLTSLDQLAAELGLSLAELKRRGTSGEFKTQLKGGKTVVAPDAARMIREKARHAKGEKGNLGAAPKPPADPAKAPPKQAEQKAEAPKPAVAKQPLKVPPPKEG